MTKRFLSWKAPNWMGSRRMEDVMVVVAGVRDEENERGGGDGGVLLEFEDFDFVAIGVGDEGHFAFAGGEGGAPIGGPDFDVGLFEGVAIGDDIGDAEGGVHQVFWAGVRVARRVAEFEEDLILREGEEDQLISLRGRFARGDRVAEFLVELDGLIDVGDADASVKEFDHGVGSIAQQGRSERGK